jgi:mRNA-degrading endonuclease RelE of RelBE toxin-antitoxin system
MNYKFTFTFLCERAIDKACKKNSVLEKILRKKIDEIIKNPHHYKPLKYDLAGERRVHILKNFVLKFVIDEQNKKVTFIFCTEASTKGQTSRMESWPVRTKAHSPMPVTKRFRVRAVVAIWVGARLPGTSDKQAR